MAAHNYFEQICDVMELEVPQVIAAHPLQKSLVQFTRMTSLRSDHGILPIQTEDAFLLTLELKSLPAVNVWVNGRHHVKRPVSAGNFSLVNLSVDTTVDMNLQFDSIQMHFPRATLNAIAEEQGAHAITALAMDFLSTTSDAAVRGLGHCLLPAFDHPDRANRLFLDHVALAVLAHMVHAYGGTSALPQFVRGGLAPWQVRRAQEILVSRLKGDISLEELAGECGLSRSHFARAFKKTTGRPPHRWLMEQRLERSRQLLLKSSLSMAQIADACGFADQSHYTRTFSAAMGVVPSEWRRLGRS